METGRGRRALGCPLLPSIQAWRFLGQLHGAGISALPPRRTDDRLPFDTNSSELTWRGLPGPTGDSGADECPAAAAATASTAACQKLTHRKPSTPAKRRQLFDSSRFLNTTSRRAQPNPSRFGSMTMATEDAATAAPGSHSSELPVRRPPTDFECVPPRLSSLDGEMPSLTLGP